LVGLLLLAQLTQGKAFPNSKLDLLLYWNTCQHISHGELPFIGFRFEYPPLAALVFTGPRLLGAWHKPSFGFYCWAFAFQSAMTAAMITPMIALLLVGAGRKIWAGIGFYTALLVLLHPLIVWRFDIFPALMTALAIYCLMTDRPLSAGAGLGIGIAVKLYPAVLLGLFLGYAVAHRRSMDAVRIGVAVIGINVLVLIRYFLIGSDAYLWFLRFHMQRGVQLESLWAGIMMLGKNLKLTTLSRITAFGAYEVHGPWANALLRVEIPVMVFLLMFITVLAYRRMRIDQLQTGAISIPTVTTSAFALLLVFASINKVFSPQYLVWLIPFAPFLRPSRQWLLLLMCATTTFMFIYVYHWVSNLQWRGTLVLNFRNALAILLITSLIFDLLPSKRDHACVK
jgi:uncharacterized membrane protein